MSEGADGERAAGAWERAAESGKFFLASCGIYGIIAFAVREGMHFGLWLSLVERCVRDAEAAGSNPVNPTIIVQAPASQGVGACCVAGDLNLLAG